MILRLLKPKRIHGTLRQPGYEFEFPPHASFALMAEGAAEQIHQYSRQIAQLPVHISTPDLLNRIDDSFAKMKAHVSHSAVQDVEALAALTLPQDESEAPAPLAPAPQVDDLQDEEQEEDVQALGEVPGDGDEARVRKALESDDWKAMLSLASEFGLSAPEGRNWTKSTVREALQELVS